MKKIWTLTIAAILLTLALTYAYFYYSDFERAKKTQTSTEGVESAGLGPAPMSAQVPKVIRELQIRELKLGEGRAAQKGDRLEVHYIGWLFDPQQSEGRGRKFKSSYEQGKSYTFRLGVGQVIRGWDQGLVGLRVGGTRRMAVPAALAFGENGAGSAIPPNTAVIYEVELLNIAK